MPTTLHLYNTLTRRKEPFVPRHAPHVGMYLCGPTVYGPAHLGHARSAITFDIIFRYLKHLGYQVRYVRNITDVGHLEQDADEGADKVAKQAQQEALEPMEVVQRYHNSYQRDMKWLNVQPPSIEPLASGHMTEQIAMIEQLLQKGMAYEVAGSVYFDTLAYHRQQGYGKLSGRIVEDLLAGTRPLNGQQEKRSALDFALWKRAPQNHLMRWPSPWGQGFPGWHMECTAMATKYLGPHFDIHGGGLDLLFPHHECELAQSQAAQNTPLATYWLHNNLVTIAGQKMGKSLGNAISLRELFGGTHTYLDQAYSPMTLRFFMLQAHYRSPLDVSTEALQAARKGYLKLMNGLKAVRALTYETPPEEASGAEQLVDMIRKYGDQCTATMNDDFHTAQTIAALFGLLKPIHLLHTRQVDVAAIGQETLAYLKHTYGTFVEDILGLQEELSIAPQTLLELLLKRYRQAKAQQQYDQVDALRAELKQIGISVQDTRHGVQWCYEVASD